MRLRMRADARLAAPPALAEFWAKEWICHHHPRKWVVQPASRRPGMSRNTACHPLALVIGLAVGETRWRDMTAEARGRDYLARRRSSTRRSARPRVFGAGSLSTSGKARSACPES